MPTPVKKALLIVDVQNDFCPGGSLAVPDGDRVVEPLNVEIKEFLAEGNLIFASRDWHPAETNHFKDFGGIWPAHCVQGTRGAEFHPGLNLPQGVAIISKGVGKDEDAFSAFQGKDEFGKPLLDILSGNGIEEIYVGGLATDYCVKATVLDALKFGFRVKILMDACKGVNLNKDDDIRALKEMIQAGAHLSLSARLQMLNQTIFVSEE